MAKLIAEIACRNGTSDESDIFRKAPAAIVAFFRIVPALELGCKLPVDGMVGGQ
jgi:hypothetical protein